jgi:purine-binding chemotaxis protein CheW
MASKTSGRSRDAADKTKTDKTTADKTKADKTKAGTAADAAKLAGDASDYVTFVIAGQLFGIPVLKVQDVLASCEVTRIPLAPPEIAGALNLRGRIVTAIDVRLRLGLAAREGDGEEMSIVVDQGGELYSLMVDEVGEVLSLDPKGFQRNPPTLDPRFREYSNGIYRLKERLLVVLDVDGLLDYGGGQTKAA